ncbi:MAG: beta-galactosidase [Candidatus Omnitrophica bacterium]|jgi:hypothetical protein|nr:beta-galactosidase [Candidatus Omnitrophota bacterium]
MKNIGGVICGIFLFTVVCFAAKSLPVGSNLWKAKISLGQGKGTVKKLGNNTLEFNVFINSVSNYSEDTEMKAGIVDFILKNPVKLPSDVTGFSYWIRSNNYGGIFRFLIKDKTGALYALGTKFSGLSSIPDTSTWCYGESFHFNDTEMGRVDPWVMIRLDKKDYYSIPHGKIFLVGFRFILTHTGNLQTDISDVSFLKLNKKPGNYWVINPDTAWCNRTNSVGLSAYGWNGMSQSMQLNRPHILISDMGLPPGKYMIRWEILAVDDWKIITTGKNIINVSEKIPISPSTEKVISFPLLPRGIYHLRIIAIPENGGNPIEKFCYYKIIRTNIKKFIRTNLSGKLINFSGINIFPNSKNAMAKIRISGIKQYKNVVLIYKVYSTSENLLKSGQIFVNTNKQVIIPLNSCFNMSPAIRMLVELKTSSGRLLDESDRMFGIKSVEPVFGPAVSKQGFLKNSILRDKQDWNEGTTPFYSDFSKYSKDLKVWLKEAKEDDYNAVELSAPWVEMEPMPGIYDFSCLDRITNMVSKYGLKVIWRIHALAENTPIWDYGSFQENQYGCAQGLWSGSSNLIFGPTNKNYNHAIDRFCLEISRHYAGNSTVLGYSVEGLFFDHGYLDMPWLNQYVDYSQTSKNAFVRYLKAKGYTLNKVNRLFHKDYKTWADMSLPIPSFHFSSQGNLLPNYSQQWKEFINYKIKVIGDYYMNMLKSLRKGDNSCLIYVYAVPEIWEFQSSRFVKNNIFLAGGGMEKPFPYRANIVRTRYEPIGKVARTKELVDIGYSNLLFNKPGWNAFGNYWFLHWTLNNVTADIKAAELRIKDWNSVCDQIAGVKQIVASGSNNPIFLYSPDVLLYVFQSTFVPRLYDYWSPLDFMINKNNLNIEIVSTKELPFMHIYRAPYIILPYFSTVVGSQTRKRIIKYVKDGGTLFMEATFGRYDINKPGQKNIFLKELGLPGIANESTDWSKNNVPVYLTGSKFFPKKTDIYFRTNGWNPPIEKEITPWIFTTNRSFFKIFYPLPGNYKTIGTLSNGSPAITYSKIGKGRVIIFWGVIDWAASSNLLPAINKLVYGSTSNRSFAGGLIVNFYKKDGIYFAMGRRFASYNIISQLENGNQNMVKSAGPRVLYVKTSNLPEGNYKITDILNKKEYGIFSSEKIKKKGIPINLFKGQAFLLKIEKIQ